ncbi:MAG: tyrosine-type recombinase/integrase [Cyclobacteriaceae bacterium]
MISSFTNYLAHEKRFSTHTLKAYIRDVESFSTFIVTSCDQEDITEVSSSMIRSWIVALSEKQNSSKSINRKVSSLRSFYKFLLRENYIDTDPTKGLILPKVENKIPSFIQENHLHQLFDSISFDDSFSGQRDQLILELFYGTGIRLSELINLEEHAVSLSQKVIKVRGKGNKERIIPVNATLSSCISSYLDKKSDKFNSPSSLLIVTNKGEKTYPMFIHRIVKKYLSMVLGAEKKSSHVLRHSFATHLLNKGADLNAIKELLGHASLAATQVYTHNTMDKLKSVFDQAHPKA